MQLILTIRNCDSLENGAPTRFELNRRGGRIGRAPSSDWCLPDPTRYISSNHCTVQFNGQDYELIDQSTNGTFLIGQSSRIMVPHVIRNNDAFAIGRFEVVATISGASDATLGTTDPVREGWHHGVRDAIVAPEVSASGWNRPPPSAAISGHGPLGNAWSPPMVASPPADAGWGANPDPHDAPSACVTPAALSTLPASDWSSEAAAVDVPGAEDIWGRFAESNVVDWSRGGFGTPPLGQGQLDNAVPPSWTSEPFAAGTGRGPTHASLPRAESVGTDQPPHHRAATSAPPPSTASAAHVPLAAEFDMLLKAAHVDRTNIKGETAATVTVAGDLLRRLVAGLFVLVEARARAKSQMGATSTRFDVDGNNPLKFARSPDQALVQLLNPPERGFQSADQAIEDAFKDLQAHQMATLRAMQGALRATLDRFSPSAIRSRAQQKGLLTKLLPGSNEAALWHAYEKEFGGVVKGSDEAFMDVFAKEFRQAYDESLRP